MNNKATLTVSEVTSLLKNTIETKPEFINLQIAGEISNFRRYASGHCYFTLKDSSSILKAVMFKGRAFSLKFAPKDGDKVVAIGRIGVYERDGVYQLYTDLMYLSGTGDLMINYEILKNKLAAEGLFASERKKRIPQFAKKIGVITSSSGAAIHDIITVAQRRNPGVELYLLPVTVQGSEAKYEVTKAIEFFNKYLPVDVLIIGRGGGSLEDLWAFNEEVVVRAVAFSKIPTITAVGHETDFTLVDFAADLRAATPSQAAELAVYDLIDYKRKVEELYKRNYNALKYKFTSVKLQAERLANAQVLKEPERYLSEREITLDNLELRMVSALKMILQKQEYYYSLLTSRLDANSPLSILSKGYTVVQNEKSGHLIKSVEDVQQGLRIVTNLQDGKIVSEVKSVERSK